MSKPRLCVDCAHPVGMHSHLIPHLCKAERCGCPAFVRESVGSETES
jgi:hypothetical protein